MKFGCKEIENYSFLYDSIESDVLRLRAQRSLEYYINKSAFYKMVWGMLSFAGILLPAVATFFTCIKPASWVIPLITSLTTVFSGSLALFKCAEKKSAYRNSAENLKSELSEYRAQTGRYQESSEADREQMLSDALERIIKEGYSKIESLENSKNTVGRQESTSRQ